MARVRIPVPVTTVHISSQHILMKGLAFMIAEKQKKAVQRGSGVAKTNGGSTSHAQVRSRGSSIATPLAFVVSIAIATYVSLVPSPPQQVSKSQSGSIIQPTTFLISMFRCQRRLWKWSEGT